MARGEAWPDEKFTTGDIQRETGVDAIAISVGNVHLQTSGGDVLVEGRIPAIEAVTDVPLVIHGGSGVLAAQRTAHLKHLQIQYRHRASHGLRHGASRCGGRGP